jgi:hypothetical protein
LRVGEYSFNFFFNPEVTVMGKYADQVNRQNQHLSQLAVREQKNQRSKQRSAERRAERRLRAEEMTEGWRSLTFEEQLAALDRRLGKDVGAKKQRARIKAAIAKRIKADAEEKATTRSKKKRRKRESGKHS